MSHIQRTFGHQQINMPVFIQYMRKCKLVQISYYTAERLLMSHHYVIVYICLYMGIQKALFEACTEPLLRCLL